MDSTLDAKPLKPLNVIYGLYCVCEGCGPDNEEVKYVGQSSVGAAMRFYHHRHAVNSGKQWASSRWMRKHGVENIRYTVLESLETAAGLDAAEERWIIELKTLVDQNGYNITPGGKSVRGYKHRPDAKSRIGRTHTAETRAKLSLAQKGKVGSLANNVKINESIAAEIKRDLWSGLTIAECAKLRGQTEGIVASISTNSTWNHVPWPIGPRRRDNPGTFSAGHQAGEAHPDAIFTEDDIRAIRRKRDAGTSYAALGREYGTSGTNIGFICRRVTWKHVT